MVCACIEETSELITAVSLSFPLCVCVYVSNLSPVGPHCHHRALIYYMVWFCQHRYQPKSLLWERKEDGESRKNNQFSLIECFFILFYFTHEICIAWMCILSRISYFLKQDRKPLLCFPGYIKSIVEREQADREKSCWCNLCENCAIGVRCVREGVGNRTTTAHRNSLLVFLKFSEQVVHYRLHLST